MPDEGDFIGSYFDEVPGQRSWDSPIITFDDPLYDWNGNLVRVPYREYALTGATEGIPSIRRISWRD